MIAKNKFATAVLQRTSQKLPYSTIPRVTQRNFGSFEQHYSILPRYFLVTYQLNEKELDRQILSEGPMQKSPIYLEHADKCTQQIQSQKLLFRSETIAPSNDDSTDAQEDESKAQSQKKQQSEVYFVFNGRDERDPHAFIKADPLYQQGIVQKWKITEMDLAHRERDDELVLTGQYN